MPGVFPFYGDVNDRSHTVTADEGDPQMSHQLVVAGGNLFPVYGGKHAVAAYFTDILHAGTVYFFPVGSLKASADGMR